MIIPRPTTAQRANAIFMLSPVLADKSETKPVNASTVSTSPQVNRFTLRGTQVG